MNCYQTRLRLALHLDCELPQGEREKIEEHLSGCAVCRKELEALRSTARMADAWKVEGADLWQGIAAAMDDEPEVVNTVEAQAPAVIALLLEMQQEIRELKSEVFALRSELSSRIGSLSMRTREPVDGPPRMPLGKVMSQRMSARDVDWGISQDALAEKVEYTRLTSAHYPPARTWPVKIEEDDLWN